MSQYRSTLTSNNALGEFDFVLRRSKSESDLMHAEWSSAIEVATAQTVFTTTYSEGVEELFIPGKVDQSTQTDWDAQWKDGKHAEIQESRFREKVDRYCQTEADMPSRGTKNDCCSLPMKIDQGIQTDFMLPARNSETDNITEYPIPATIRGIEIQKMTAEQETQTETALPVISSREVQTDVEIQKAMVDQGIETTFIPTPTSVERGTQTDNMQKWAVEQETQTETLITPTRPSDQSSQTDFDIAERKVEQGIQTESIWTRTFTRGIQTVDIQKHTNERETQTAILSKPFHRHVQTEVSMQKVTVEHETQTESAIPQRISDQIVQTDINTLGAKVDQGIQTNFLPTQNTISKGIQAIQNTAEQEMQTETTRLSESSGDLGIHNESVEVTSQPGADNEEPEDVEKISQLVLHPHFAFQRQYKGAVVSVILTVGVTVFAIYYGYNAGVSRDPFTHLLWSSSDWTVVTIVGLSQLSITLLNGLLSAACQSLRWSRASSERGINLLSFLVLSPFLSAWTLLVLLWFGFGFKAQSKRLSLSAFDYSVVGLALQRYQQLRSRLTLGW